MTKVAVVVPLKRFDVAKDRLRRAGTQRVSDLARELARGVIENCAPRPVIVLSESSDVTRFARDLGAEVLESQSRDLNETAQNAYAQLGRRFDQLIFVHGDLKHPEGLGSFAPDEGVTIVTDHRGEGTNVLVVPTGTAFRFAYGPDSKELHQREAERLSLRCRVIANSPWGFDIDEPEDLEDGQTSI